MTGRGPGGYVVVPPNQRAFDHAVGAFRQRKTSTPRKNKKKRRSRSAAAQLAFGQKVPQHPDQPRTSVIKRSGSQEAPRAFRNYPTPSLKTPKRALTMPETPIVLRTHPNIAANAHNIPTKPPAPPKSKPQERMSRPRGRHPLRDVQQIPAWVERLSQPKKYPGQLAVGERPGSVNSSLGGTARARSSNSTRNDSARRQLTF